MPKRVQRPPEPPGPEHRKEKARRAFESVVESIHDDNRALEGKELWAAVREVFAAFRPASNYKDPK